jgi:uncharacterized protein YjbJ (UPF0337 family)
VVGKVIGNPSQQTEGESKKVSAEAEHDASKAAVKAGPFTLSSTGAVAQDSSDRSAGSWNQTIGAGKEAIGNLIGSESLKQDGIRQNREGKEQEAAGQLNDLGQGVADRAKGAVGAAVAGLTGDQVEQEKRQQQHDVGKSLQRGVELDLAKQAQAQEKPKE